MLREPPFRNLAPPLKILALIMVMIVTFLVVLASGVALSIPFFGRGLLDNLASVSNYNDPQTIFALKYFQIVNQIGVFILPAFLFVILTDNNITGYLKMDRSFKRFSTIFGFIVLIVSLPFVNWLVKINGDIHLPDFMAGIERWMRNSEDSAQKLTDAFLASSSWGGLILNLLMIAGLAAIGEELIFRGILVRLFHEWTKNVHVAVVLSAFLFSTLHLQFFGFLPRLALGLILGYSFIWSGSLWVPIIIHFVNNAAAVMISYLSALGVISTDLESIGASDHPLVIAGSFVVSAAILAFIFYHERVVRQGRVFK